MRSYRIPRKCSTLQRTCCMMEFEQSDCRKFRYSEAALGAVCKISLQVVRDGERTRMTTLTWADVVLEEWLASLHAQTTTAASRSVLNVLMQQPERASQASTQWIADTAGVNIASVTRAAQ